MTIAVDLGRKATKQTNNQRVKYGTLIKSEGIIKAILENPKTDQNTLSHLECTFSI